MTSRLFQCICVAGALLALAASSATAQAQTAAKKASPPAKTYTAPRTLYGQPDLQGYWSNTTYTPLQRPDNINREFFTKEEAEEVIKRAATEEGEQTQPGTIADVHYDFTQFGLDRSQSALALNLRTSLIVDPPDGKLPPLTPEGRSRADERAAARKQAGGPFDRAQNQSLSVRCINMDRDGPPMLAGAYNNNYQDRAVRRICPDPRRDASRSSRHPAGQASAASGEYASAYGKFPWPLGRRYARHRNDELHRENRLSGFERKDAFDRTLHPHG
jgi:hypothetical protein